MTVLQSVEHQLLRLSYDHWVAMVRNKAINRHWPAGVIELSIELTRSTIGDSRFKSFVLCVTEQLTFYCVSDRFVYLNKL